MNKEQFKNYLSYFKEFRQRLDAGGSFSITKLKKKHDVPNNINMAAHHLGILDIKGQGRSTRYSFIVDDVTLSHVEEVSRWISDNSRESSRKYYHRGGKESLSLLKSNIDNKTKETTWEVFGIKLFKKTINLK